MSEKRLQRPNVQAHPAQLSIQHSLLRDHDAKAPKRMSILYIHCLLLQVLSDKRESILQNSSSHVFGQHVQDLLLSDLHGLLTESLQLSGRNEQPFLSRLSSPKTGHIPPCVCHI